MERTTLMPTSEPETQPAPEPEDTDQPPTADKPSGDDNEESESVVPT